VAFIAALEPLLPWPDILETPTEENTSLSQFPHKQVGL